MGADKPDSGFLLKFAAGCAAGGLGSIVGNPFDVLKTKMMAAEDKALGLQETIREVYRGQGMGGFYRGIDANIARAMVNNGTKMACYDTIKHNIRQTGVLGQDGILLQAASSFTAGFLMTCTVAPFDMVRTQLMNQPSEGPRLYSGFMDCLFKIVGKEGPLALWKGFIPMWARIAPNAMISLILFEQLTLMAGGKTM
uniref:Uncharacterized protein n=2 Tax=Rhizochromulina marina TaxID=1034831 RepID=A0A7S2RVT7_9STRA|mmetsp:Transcript_21705/g.63186  ORF Transcript_21705/g.63186 Transcript_21705/m.63186 type:complete len:197 (+) Transcript_21705:59-649(+)